MMDSSPGSGSIILRASLIMEKAVTSLKCNSKRGNQDARDWCVRCLTLLDLLSTAGPSGGHDSGMLSAKIPHIDQLLTAAAAIENILSDLSAIEAARQETNEHVDAKSKNGVNHTDFNHLNGVDASTEINKEERIPISFEEVVGNLEAKQSLYENVILPLSISEATKVRVFSGIRAGSGNVMLYGPAGTGKTIMCQAAAYEAKAELIIVRPSDVLSKYHGESERYLRGVFERARTLPRAVIFFDEFDAIAATRGGMQDSMSSRRLLSELLLQLTEQKQLQARDAQLLRLKLASVQAPSKRPRSLKRQTENKNDSYSSGSTVDRVSKYPRVVSASHPNRKQSVWGADSDPCRAEVRSAAATGHRNRTAAGRSNIRIDMDAEIGERDFIIGTPLITNNTCGLMGMGHEDRAESDEEIATEKDEDEDDKGVGRGVVIIAATNRLEDIDPAVVRRFESRVYVGVPEHDTRMAMVTTFLRYGNTLRDNLIGQIMSTAFVMLENNHMGLDTVLSEQDLDTISSSTTGWSGSEIETLCREAAMAPVRAVWGYPLNASRAVRKGNDDTMIGSYSSDENKSGEGNPCCTESEEMNAPTALMAATADLNAHETDTIRPIGLNDFRIDVMMKKGSD